jgi:hypothetical protein
MPTLPRRYRRATYRVQLGRPPDPRLRPRSEAEQRAGFALVIGVNKSVDRGLKKLRYADDDAVRYFELFRSLGLRTALVTRSDANTRRIHPQALAEAHLPLRSELSGVIQRLAREIARAHRRGLKTVLYVAYAGHGNGACRSVLG